MSEKTIEKSAPTKRVQSPSKWVKCPHCKLRIRAEGSNADERQEAHEKGLHCAPRGSNKSPHRR